MAAPARAADPPLSAAAHAADGTVVPKHPCKSAAEYHAGRVDGPLKCTWFPGMTEEQRAADPHTHIPRGPRPKILSSVLEAIGNTPLVRLNRLPREEGVPEGVELLAKVEFFNAGGSVKDRIGYRMVIDAEKSGRIKPGDTLIEPTSGNTGIGLALTAALRGYRMIITLPEKMSQEKVDVLKALGAEIIRTPTEAAWDSPESHIGVARRLQQELPNAHILDQYNNPSNPMAHVDGTAEEIWEACEGRIDMLVASAGTGGTLTGTARRLKELNPHLIVVGVDPKGSILAEPDSLNDEKRLQSYTVEGIGYDFVPKVLDRAIVDYWVKSDDKESLIMARRLIREEGLLVGGSSGSAMVGALKAAAQLKPGQRCVVILPDSVRNYMSKFLNDAWMARNGFVDAERDIGTGPDHGQAWWSSRTVADLGVHVPVTVGPAVTVQEAVQLMNSLGFDQLPVVDNDNSIVGVTSEGHISGRLLTGRVKPGDSVTKALFTSFRKVTVGTKLSELARVFDTEHYAVVVQTQRVYTGAPGVTEKSVVVGVVTRIDLLRFITAGGPDGVGTPRTPTSASAASSSGAGATKGGAAASGGAPAAAGF